MGLFLPFSIRSIRRCGVPTAIPVRVFWRKETCSSSLKCLANCAVCQPPSPVFDSCTLSYQLGYGAAFLLELPDGSDEVCRAQAGARHDDGVWRAALLGGLVELPCFPGECLEEVWQVLG